MQHPFKKTMVQYLYISGLIAHILFLGLFISQPYLFNKITAKLHDVYYAWQKQHDYVVLTQGKNLSLPNEINMVFSAWQPKQIIKDIKNRFEINGVGFSDLSTAIAYLSAGDELFIAEGIYDTPMIIDKDNITITGIGHVIFENGIADNKGFIVSKGNNLTINNIECRYIVARDGNGACVRQEGSYLSLDHVYFHQSQQGVLETSGNKGVITVKNSRFEQLGFNGRANGIYTNHASVNVQQSLFVATKEKGHAIKVKGPKLTINQSILVSLSAEDSRLVDMPNGGEFSITRSLLGQGPKSVNGQLIGYGLEGMSKLKNSINLIENVIYLERLGANYMLTTPKGIDLDSLIQKNNIIIGNDNSSYKSSDNTYFIDRTELGVPPYPKLPNTYCRTWSYCPIK
jgi:predicted transport protein